MKLIMAMHKLRLTPIANGVGETANKKSLRVKGAFASLQMSFVGTSRSLLAIFANYCR